MVDRATSRDVLLDPRALVRFLNAALAAVRADPGLTEDELVALGTELRHVSGNDIRFRTVPIANPSYRAAGAGAVALWDAAAASAMFTAMREDTARPHRRQGGGAGRPDDPAGPDAACRSTTARGPRARHARQPDLAGRGFATAGPAQNWQPHGRVTTTVLRYDARYSESIKTLAAALPGARLVAGGRARSHHAGRHRLAVRGHPRRPGLGGGERDRRRRRESARWTAAPAQPTADPSQARSSLDDVSRGAPRGRGGRRAAGPGRARWAGLMMAPRRWSRPLRVCSVAPLRSTRVSEASRTLNVSSRPPEKSTSVSLASVTSTSPSRQSSKTTSCRVAPRRLRKSSFTPRNRTRMSFALDAGTAPMRPPVTSESRQVDSAEVEGGWPAGRPRASRRTGPGATGGRRPGTGRARSRAASRCWRSGPTGRGR